MRSGHSPFGTRPWPEPEPEPVATELDESPRQRFYQHDLAPLSDGSIDQSACLPLPSKGRCFEGFVSSLIGLLKRCSP